MTIIEGTTNNPPYAELQIDKPMHDFLMDVCERNMEFALKVLQSVHDGKLAISDPSIVNMFELNEKFMKFRRLLEDGVI